MNPKVSIPNSVHATPPDLSTGQTRSEAISNYLLKSASVHAETARACAGEIELAVRKTVDVLKSGGKLLLCGNGGSAANCQHLAAQFVSALSRPFQRPAFPAIALTANASLLTAAADDFRFDGVYARALEALGRQGDLLFALSASGESPSVVLAVKRAGDCGLQTIAITGQRHSKVAELAQTTIRVPCDEITVVQEAQLAIGHILCHLVEQALDPEGDWCV